MTHSFTGDLISSFCNKIEVFCGHILNVSYFQRLSLKIVFCIHNFRSKVGTRFFFSLYRYSCLSNRPFALLCFLTTALFALLLLLAASFPTHCQRSNPVKRGWFYNYLWPPTSHYLWIVRIRAVFLFNCSQVLSFIVLCFALPLWREKKRRCPPRFCSSFE